MQGASASADVPRFAVMTALSAGALYAESKGSTALAYRVPPDPRVAAGDAGVKRDRWSLCVQCAVVWGERLGLDRCRMRRSAQGTGGAPFSTKAKVFITRNAETTFELHGKHVLPAIHICNLNHKCDTHIATEVLLPFRLPLVPYNKNTRASDEVGRLRRGETQVRLPHKRE
eukprot:scaffold41869_cov66-Phaeocystis_antarctica.AAC.2